MKPIFLLLVGTVVAAAVACTNGLVNDSPNGLLNVNSDKDTGEPKDSTAEIASDTEIASDMDTGIKTDTEAVINTDTGANILCGNGVVDEGEECDDGVLAGEYGGCSPGCVLGPGCGDGIVQPQYEECDVGGDPTVECCTPQCKILAIIGCDYIQCGDGIVQPGEECDDGVLAGEYGGCAPGCVLGPRCGDGIIQPEFEQCDDGLDNGLFRCSKQCRELLSD
jgi:cysteine-rich repeat protein